MASIAFKNVDGSTLSRVTILKDGRALEVNPPTKKTWPSMDAWVCEMPREWPRVEAWTRVPLPVSREKARRLYYTKQKQKTVVAGPHLAYFLKLPDGVTTTNREEVREALASYMERYMWLSCHVFWKVYDLKPAHPLYHLDDFLVTLTGLDPRGTFTARQILNAVLARHTWAFAVAPAPPASAGELKLIEGEFYWVQYGNVYEYDQIEETPGDFVGRLIAEETIDTEGEELVPEPEIVKLTAISTHLARYNLMMLVENSRLKAEIEALKARLVTIKAACG